MCPSFTATNSSKASRDKSKPATSSAARQKVTHLGKLLRLCSGSSANTGIVSPSCPIVRPGGRLSFNGMGSGYPTGAACLELRSTGSGASAGAASSRVQRQRLDPAAGAAVHTLHQQRASRRKAG
jgi:hypothetical protein